MKRVIVVGAGFGGLAAAKKMGRKEDLDVLVIDRRNYHLFQPLLYQVATAGLSPAEIAVPIRSELSRYKNVKVRLDNVTSVDLSGKTVSIGADRISFDYLLLACGSKHSYFGHEDWEDFAPGLKTLEQATEIRRRILLAYEMAEKETDPEKQKSLLTFVVVGGGPTGVEMAGAIAEISRHTLEKDFRNIDPSRTRVMLIEANDRILRAFAPELAKSATRDLEQLGVQLWTSTRVTKVTDEGVHFQDEVIKAKTVIWAAGVQPSSLSKTLKTPLDKMGRVIVEKDLSLPGFPYAFVIGDQAHFKTEADALPGLAPVAIQEGQWAAQNIWRSAQGKATKPFHYLDKGQMATIGRSRAIMEFAGLKASGFFAWLAWLVVHIYYLVGFQNKFFVFLRWVRSYFSFRKGARLIVNRDWRTNQTATDSKSPVVPAQPR